MKKVILLTLSLAASITFISCTSNEEKVQELIKNEMFRTLYDFESYEPIETKIDSSFNSIYDNVTVLAYASLINKNVSKGEELLDEIDDDLSTAEIYAGSYSSYSRAKSKQALKRIDENFELAKTLQKQNVNYQISIRKIIDTLNLDFIGWKATHKFRCKNKGGNFDIGNNEYIINFSFDSIIKSKNLDDKSNNEIINLIDEVINMKDSLSL